MRTRTYLLEVAEHDDRTKVTVNLTTMYFPLATKVPLGCTVDADGRSLLSLLRDSNEIVARNFQNAGHE